MNFINKKIVDIGFIPFENVKTNNESEQKGVITLEPDLDNNAGVLGVLFYDTPTLAQYTPDSSLRFLVLRNSEYD